MTSTSPIIPPPELVEEWANDSVPMNANAIGRDWERAFAARAAQWGADQELEACCLWLNGGSKIDYDTAALLRAARRTKPPSLKEQALLAIDTAVADDRLSADVANIVRRALEALDD